MAAKVNIVLDDDVKAELERLVESGSRSRVINQALRKELQSMRRTRAAAQLDTLRAKAPKTSTADIVEAIRRDRGRP